MSGQDMSARQHFQGGVGGRVSREILQAWSEYVGRELARFYATTGQDRMMIWRETPKALRAVDRLSRGLPAGYGATPDELAAFSGAWHTIAPHVIDEFRQWIAEDWGSERLTLTQFAARYRAESGGR